MVRIYALLTVIALVGLIIVYTWEFNWLTNTVHARRLVIGSCAGGLLVSTGICWYFRERFTPLSKHIPEVSVIALFVTFFSPLLGSLLNRLPSFVQYEPYIFKSEQGFVTKGYGLLKSESIRPTGWILRVEKNGKAYRFKYSAQPYFPISQPGDTIELPIRHGLLGFDVLEL